MNVLILGGAGFVGANLARRCLAEPGVRLTVLDSLDPRFHSTQGSLHAVRDRLTFVEGDLLDEPLLRDVVGGQDVVFNCAGQTSHSLSLQQPLLDAQINCAGNLLVLETLRQHNPRATVVFTSSTSVIGSGAGQITEDHIERPRDIYSANKGVAEKYHQIYHSVHNLPTVCLRLPNLYGPYGKSDPQFGFLNYFIHLAHAGESIPVFGSGEQRRNVLYVEDATEILWQASREPRLHGGILLAVGDHHPTVREIAERIDVCFGGGGLEQRQWPEQRHRMEIGSVEFSSARLRGITRWRPRFDLDGGLRRTRQIMDSMPSEADL